MSCSESSSKHVFLFPYVQVETIGDAYMVCGGLPERIDYHAHEIACMALDFLAEVEGFVIDHMLNTKLKLRIGMAVRLMFVEIPCSCLLFEPYCRSLLSKRVYKH